MSEQTRNPTSDDAVAGTWTGSAGSRWQSVDDYPDTVPTDTLTHGTTAGNLTLGFSALSIPAGATAIQVHVDYYDRKSASQSCTFGARLKVGGSYFNASTHNPSTTLTQRTDTFANNPKSGVAWTVDDVNGVGSNGLQAFGYNSGSDASPTIVTSSIRVRVTYTDPSTGVAIAGTAAIQASVLDLDNPIGTAVNGVVATQTSALDLDNPIDTAITGGAAAQTSALDLDNPIGTAVIGTAASQASSLELQGPNTAEIDITGLAAAQVSSATFATGIAPIGVPPPVVTVNRNEWVLGGGGRSRRRDEFRLDDVEDFQRYLAERLAKLEEHTQSRGFERSARTGSRSNAMYRSARTGGGWDNVASATEQEAEAQWYNMQWPPDKTTAETAGAAIGGVAAAGACAAVGAGLASPLCAAVGQWLGDKVGGLIYDGVEYLLGGIQIMAVGTGHEYYRFAAYAGQVYNRLELRPPINNFDAYFTYLRSIGINLQGDTATQYLYGCEPNKLGSVYIDDRLVYRYACYPDPQSRYAKTVHTGDANWWSQAERVLIARATARAAKERVKAANQASVESDVGTDDNTAIAVVGGLGVLGLGYLLVKSWL